MDYRLGTDTVMNMKTDYGSCYLLHLCKGYGNLHCIFGNAGLPFPELFPEGIYGHNQEEQSHSLRAAT